MKERAEILVASGSKSTPLSRKLFYSFAFIGSILVLGFLVLHYVQMKDNIEKSFHATTVSQMDHLKQIADTFIMSVAEDEIVYSLNTDPEIRRLFIADLRTNNVTISRAYETINRVVSKHDIIHSVFVHFAYNNLILSNLGAVFPHVRNEIFYGMDWVTEHTDNSWSLIEDFLHEVSYPNQVDVFMLKRSYPLSSRDAEHFRGSYIVCLDTAKMVTNIKTLGSNYFDAIHVYEAQAGILLGATPADQSIADVFSNVTDVSGWAQHTTDRRRRIYYSRSDYAPVYYVGEVTIKNIDIVSIMIDKNLGVFIVIMMFVLVCVSILLETWIYAPIRRILSKSHSINRQILGRDIEETSEDKLLNLTLTQLVNKIRELETNISFDEPELRNAFIRKLVDNSISGSRRLADYLSRLGLVMPFHSYWCVRIHLGDDTQLANFEMDSLRFNLIYLIENLHNAFCVKIAADVFDGLGCMIVNSDTEEQVKRLCSTIGRYADDRLSFKLTFVIGPHQSTLRDCYLSYQAASRAQDYVYFYPEARVLVMSELLQRIGQDETPDFTKVVGQLKRTKGPEEVSAHLNQVFNKMVEHPGEIEDMRRFMNELDALLQEMGARLEAPEYRSWNYFPNFSAYREYLDDWLEQLIELQQIERKSRTYRLIERISAYIQEEIEHNPDRVALKTVSDSFSINPNYLSHAFKKYSKTSFKEYITQLKLAKASRMLKAEGDRPIYDIANQLGYYNTSHFIHIFRECFGLTPHEYRNAADSHFVRSTSNDSTNHESAT